MPTWNCVWRWALFLGCSVALAYGLFRPEPPPQLYAGAVVESDKLLHVAAFAAFCLSARLALTWVSGVRLWGALLALAPLTEWLQHFLQPARTFSIADIGANAVGVTLAFVLALACERLQRRGAGDPCPDARRPRESQAGISRAKGAVKGNAYL